MTAFDTVSAMDDAVSFSGIHQTSQGDVAATIVSAPASSISSARSALPSPSSSDENISLIDGRSCSVLLYSSDEEIVVITDSGTGSIYVDAMRYASSTDYTNAQEVLVPAAEMRV